MKRFGYSQVRLDTSPGNEYVEVVDWRKDTVVFRLASDQLEDQDYVEVEIEKAQLPFLIGFLQTVMQGEKE